MAEVSEPKAVELLDLATGKVRDLPGSKGLFSPRWSPDGRYIAALLRWVTASQGWGQAMFRW